MLSLVKNKTMKLVKCVDKKLQHPTVKKVEDTILRWMPAIALLLVVTLVYSQTAVYATAQDLLTKILKIMGIVCNVMGVAFGGVGIMHFASAQADGDGPAKQKAIQQIAAAVVLLVVGSSLYAGGSWLISELGATEI